MSPAISWILFDDDDNDDEDCGVGALDGEDDDDDDAGGVDDEDEDGGVGALGGEGDDDDDAGGVELLFSAPGTSQCRRASFPTISSASLPVGNGTPTQGFLRATLNEMAKTEFSSST